MNSNILLTCAGRRIQIVTAFKAAVGAGGQVLACDASAEAPALQEADQAFVVPRVSEPGYIDALLALCAKHHVRLLIPAFETELPLLAAARSRFEALGTIPVVSSPAVVAQCFDKLETARFLESCGLSVPRTFLSLKAARKAVAAGELAFPVIVKPRWGVSSIGLHVAEDDEEIDLAFRLAARQVSRTLLAEVSATDPEHCILVQEHLAGHEYGMDIVNDLHGRHVGTFVKRKLRMLSGQTDRAVTVVDPRLAALGRLIGERLGHVGLLDCDLFVNGAAACVIDLNPRLGGGYPYSHLAGANYPAALLAWAEGRAADPRWLQIEPNLTISRCDRFVVARPNQRTHQP